MIKLLIHISDNRYSWGKRRIEELQEEIKVQKEVVKSTKGFLNKLKEKRNLRKLFKLQIKHGNEVLEYERQKANAK